MKAVRHIVTNGNVIKLFVCFLCVFFVFVLLLFLLFFGGLLFPLIVPILPGHRVSPFCDEKFIMLLQMENSI